MARICETALDATGDHEQHPNQHADHQPNQNKEGQRPIHAIAKERNRNHHGVFKRKEDRKNRYDQGKNQRKYHHNLQDLL